MSSSWQEANKESTTREGLDLSKCALGWGGGAGECEGYRITIVDNSQARRERAIRFGRHAHADNWDGTGGIDFETRLQPLSRFCQPIKQTSLYDVYDDSDTGAEDASVVCNWDGAGGIDGGELLWGYPGHEQWLLTITPSTICTVRRSRRYLLAHSKVGGKYQANKEIISDLQQAGCFVRMDEQVGFVKAFCPK